MLTVVYCFNLQLVLDELSWLVEECSGSKPPRKGTLLGLILTGEVQFHSAGDVTVVVLLDGVRG